MYVVCVCLSVCSFVYHLCVCLCVCSSVVYVLMCPAHQRGVLRACDYLYVYIYSWEFMGSMDECPDHVRI